MKPEEITLALNLATAISEINRRCEGSLRFTWTKSDHDYFILTLKFEEGNATYEDSIYWYPDMSDTILEDVENLIEKAKNLFNIQ